MNLSELYVQGTSSSYETSNVLDRMKALKQCFDHNYNKVSVVEYIKNGLYTQYKQDFMTNYNKNVNMIETCCIIPTFEELPLLFIPVQQNQYYIYNKVKDTLDGPITITQPDLVEDDAAVVYQPLLIVEQYELPILSQFFSINQYGPIYLTLENDNSRLMLFSYLQLQEAGQYFNDNHPFYLFENNDALLNQLYESDYLALPQNIVCDNHDNTLSIMTEQILKIHTHRITRKHKKKPLLSICIPTYNRGNLALEKLDILQQLSYNTEIEFIISNNGSTKGCEYYDEIEARTEIDNRIIYHRFEENQQFLGNFWKVLQMSNSNHALLISDEDYLHTDALPHYLGILHKYPQIGVIRSSGNQFYLPHQMKNNYCKAGSDALKAFFLANNYLSGIIYNTSVIPEHLQSLYQDKFIDNEAFRHYPHEFLDMYLCNRYDFMSNKVPLFLCGEAEIYEEYTVSTGQMTYMTKESRLLQLLGFIHLINEMIQIDDMTRLTLYSIACKKTLFLLHMNKLESDDWDQNVKEYQEYCLEAFQLLNLVYKSHIDSDTVHALVQELSVL